MTIFNSDTSTKIKLIQAEPELAETAGERYRRGKQSRSNVLRPIDSKIRASGLLFHKCSLRIHNRVILKTNLLFISYKSNNCVISFMQMFDSFM